MGLFIPINDNNSESFQKRINNGNHWSLLLVILANDRTVYYLHFDSCKRYNCIAAQTVSKKISYMLMLSNSNNATEEIVVNVIECRTPQQRNGYDRGIYLLVLTEIL